jgi:hypothetical protein
MGVCPIPTSEGDHKTKMETIVKRYDPVSRRLIDVRFDICPPPPPEVTYVFDAQDTNFSQSGAYVTLSSISFPSTTTFTMMVTNALHLEDIKRIAFVGNIDDLDGLLVSISDVSSSTYTNVAPDANSIQLIPANGYSSIPLTTSSIITLNIQPRSSFESISIQNLP